MSEVNIGKIILDYMFTNMLFKDVLKNVNVLKREGEGMSEHYLVEGKIKLDTRIRGRRID